MAKGKLHITSKSYSNIFPFTLTIGMGKNMDLRTVVETMFKTGYISLAPIVNGDYNCVEAFVYNNPNDTEIFLVLTDQITVDTLVHECIHITSRVFDIIRTNFSEDSEEFFAYITQFILRDCYKIISEDFKGKLKPIGFEEKEEEEDK